MNKWLSILRHALTFGGGLVVANNPSISVDNVNGVIGAVLTITGAVWGAVDEHLAEKK